MTEQESRCKGCGASLFGGQYATALDDREPCPHCGSVERDVILRARTAVVNVTLGDVTVHATGVVGLPPPPDFLLRAVVEARGRTIEGEIIAALAPAWDWIVSALIKDPSAAFQLDPRKFEELIAASYERAGFDEVILTPRSGDLGRDVIATKRGLWTVRILDQVKRYAPGHVVPANDVRAFCHVLAADGRASKGLVTTTSDFAPGCATEFASMMPTRLELVNGPELLRRLDAIKSGKN